MLMRDAVVGAIAEAAADDRDIIFVSADFGAAALDSFRRDLPDQFIHAGISEQNMVDLAAGLALGGKKVFLYAMAPFITARCYEQTKSVLAAMNLPVTLIAVGVGLGYDHATLTHFTPEDIAIMRALNRINVMTPADEESCSAIARHAVAHPGFRYLRLERQPLPPIYGGAFADAHAQGFHIFGEGRDLAVVACGYMTHKALRARDDLSDLGIDAAVIDLFRIKPLDAAILASALSRFGAILTVEEQMLEGGMGSAVAEVLADTGIRRPLRRLGLRDGFDVVNGNRDELHALYGIDTGDIVAAAFDLSRAELSQ
jgi:transketolase